LIRASLVRALTVSAIVAGSLALAGCYGEEGGYELPTRAMKALSPQMVALLEQKNMPKESPILVRIFKEESELEVWKQDTSGRFQLLKVYPICRWSGDLGPKVNEGDRQAPEGFYTITPGLMNPNSNYYLAINTGFPNAYDRANDRHGGFLMIHGDCSSRGCYAMTDEQIGEIYSLAREAFLGGQPSFQIQAYPFRLTRANLAGIQTNPKIARLASEKQHADEVEYAQLVQENVSVAPIYSGLDGGMNKVFLAQFPGRIIPLAIVLLNGSQLPQLPPVPWADNDGSLASKFFGALFESKAASQAQVVSTDSATQERGADSATTGSGP